ncbi:DUF1566 domain-containing protein [bacterium]|nr:DUF1566 domain-containing protein [bacterium]
MSKKILVVATVAFVFIASCGDSGKSDSESDNSLCKYDTYQCFYNRSWYGDSYYCGFAENNKLDWHLSELCEYGCNEHTGKCYTEGSGIGTGYDDNSNSGSNSGDNTDNEVKTRTADCTGLPENAEWNTVSSITQKKNGSSWTPSSQGTYNTKASTTECRFKCIDGYLWNGSKCLNPCEPNPCDNFEGATGVCTVIENGYKCECAEGFIWNGSECIDPCNPNPCRDKENSTHICTIDENNTDFYFCECEDKHIWFQGECRRDLCDPNPCLEVENATGYCKNAQDYSDYMCECDNSNFEWNGTICKTFPVCSPESETPCKDSQTGLIWSARSLDAMDWTGAVSYCENSTEDGFKDWRLPTINELRTLIRNCSGTRIGGSCPVKDPDCLIVYCADTNACRCEVEWDTERGFYSKFGESSILWSSSAVSDFSGAWVVNFFSAFVVFHTYGDSDPYVRCVR